MPALARERAEAARPCPRRGSPGQDRVRRLSQGLPRARPCVAPPAPCLRTRAGLPAPVGRHADRVLPSVPAEHLYGKTDETDVRLDICDDQEGADENNRWRSLTTLRTVQFVERLLDLTALGHELGSGEPGQQTLVVVPGGVPLPDRDRHPVVFYRTAPPRPSRFQEGTVGVDEVHRVGPPGLALVPGRPDQPVG